MRSKNCAIKGCLTNTITMDSGSGYKVGCQKSRFQSGWNGWQQDPECDLDVEELK